MKAVKRITRWVLILALLAGLYVGGVIAYAWVTDYLPEPQEASLIQDSGNPQLNIATDSFSLFLLEYRLCRAWRRV
jgi:hypothetical protein